MTNHQKTSNTSQTTENQLQFPFFSFVYQSSGDPVQFTNWDDNEPSNRLGEEHCTEVVPQRQGKWNDIMCHWKRSFVCQNPAREIKTKTNSSSDTILFDCYRTSKLTRFDV